MFNSKFISFLRFIKNKNIIITTHELVDIDGLVSCFALKFFLNHSFKNQNFLIYFPELSKSTKNYLDNFSTRFPNLDLSSLESINYSNVDVFLIVDTNNLNQINSEISKNLSNLEIPYIFIDHHYLGEKSEINTCGEGWRGRALILIGGPECCCPGADLGAVQASGSDELPVETSMEDKIRDFPKPTIAAICKKDWGGWIRSKIVLYYHYTSV